MLDLVLCLFLLLVFVFRFLKLLDMLGDLKSVQHSSKRTWKNFRVENCKMRSVET